MSGFTGYGAPAGGYPYGGYPIPTPVSNYMSQPQQPVYQQPPPQTQYGAPAGNDYWAQLQPAPQQQQTGYGANGDAPADVGVDPNAFRRFFMSQLATLTFNSKPVITNLTLFAHQHLLRMSTIVAACLEDHLKNCPPSGKLPGLYLLDSISKNIGPPYISLFCRFIERVFLSAYHVVDPPTKTKMEELLGTWRTGGSDGGELFRSPDEGRNGRVQHGIEQALFGTAGRGGGLSGARPSVEFQNGMAQHPTAARQDERADVLLNVRRLLQIRQDQAILNPEDPVNAGQITLLGKLESLVLNTTLSSAQIAQIRAQLQKLAPEEQFITSAPEPPRSPLPSAVQAMLSPGRQQQFQPLAAPPSHPPSTEPAVPGISPEMIAQLRGLAGGDLSSLLASTQAAAAFAPSTDLDSGPDLQAAAHNALIIELNVQLTNQDILKYRPEAFSLMFDRLGVQCHQCGLRFIQSPLGKQRMDKHLDWHFTHKRRVREGAGRAQGRSWFSMEEDWIISDSVELEYDGADGAGQPAAGSSKAGAEAKVDRAELLKRKVVVPSDKSKAGKPCPICKERFKEEWSEPDEEWVYYNAVQVDGAIVHATCHEGSSTRLASRLKLEGDSARNSREPTPLNPAGGPGSPGGSARKRKVGEGEANGDDAGEPDEKKIKPEPV